MAKNNKKLLFHLNLFGHGESNPKLLRINLFPEYTKIDFGYITTDKYDNGGWIKISPNTFIENVETKIRYTLTNAEGITIAPAKLNFESTKDWRYFSLFFPPIPLKDCSLNIIEKENGNKNDFNYYDVSLNMKDGVEVI